MHPGNPDLATFIRGTIQRDGPVRFDWFMEQALYHSQFGYYSSGRAQIGRKGDYFTSVSVGPLFGRMLAAQFTEMWERMGQPDDFRIVEQGAHHGDFARDVLEAISEFPDGPRYCIVEPFPILRKRQEQTLAKFTERVTWFKSLRDLEPFNGVHFSNELLDSIPVRLITRETAAGWQEKFVTASGEKFSFVTQPIADDRLRAFLENIPTSENIPYETEVHLAAQDWIKEVASKLIRGFVLAVDYGYSRSEFYSPERTGGTLQAFARHRTVSSPLHKVGQIDITAHVDWTGIAKTAEQSGLDLLGFTDQHHFLTGLLTKYSPGEKERRALQTLLHPEFLGTRFQYLGLGKNVAGSPLAGFHFARGTDQTLR